MIQKLAYIFGSKTKTQEMILLLHDAKKIIRQGYYEEQLPRIEKFCRERNLHCIKSSFKVILTDEQTYTNKGIKAHLEDPREGMIFVYISKDEKEASLASYYELISNDRDLGLILGYPSCCVDFFCKNFKAQKADLQLPATNAFTNLTKRDQDLVILSHFPCQSDCEKSIILAKKYLDVLKNVDRKRVEELLKGLRV